MHSADMTYDGKYNNIILCNTMLCQNYATKGNVLRVFYSVLMLINFFDSLFIIIVSDATKKLIENCYFMILCSNINTSLLIKNKIESKRYYMYQKLLLII